LRRVPSLPLRADVRLAARQQRIADELREECHKSSGTFGAIALDVLQPKWDAWNQWRRQVSDQANEASCADVTAARDRVADSSAANGGIAAEPPAAAPAADLGAATGTLAAAPAYAAKLEEHTTKGWFAPRRRRRSRRHLSRSARARQRGRHEVPSDSESVKA
jgi:hypothetical protein